jgi:thioredoxin reductase (NADPH)
MSVRNVIIIGSGPAGYSAAIYTARANLAPLVLAGIPSGGQLMLTTLVENYPGFVDGITGPELMDAMRKQAGRFGADIVAEHVMAVDFSRRPFVVCSDDATYEAHSVIIATGASAKLLGLPSERELMGRGVSTCATCDGFFFKGGDILVVGGGDSALEEALYLSRLGRSVTVVHRRDVLRASKILQGRAFANPKIAFVWNATVEEILGAADARTTAVRVRDVSTGTRRDVPADGVFIAIGHEPNTRIFRDQVALHANGYIAVIPGTTQTSVPGVFAAGDVQDHVWRQAVTAAASGCMAALDVERYLEAAEVQEASNERTS